MRSSQLHHLNYGAYIWYGAICSKSALSALPNSRVQSSTINFRICHPRSAFGNKADHLVVLRRADHAVARSQHGFAAVCDVLSATLSARSRRQAPDDRARQSRSADGIARGLRGERIERTEPGPPPRSTPTPSLAPSTASSPFAACSQPPSSSRLVGGSYHPSLTAAPHVRAERGRLGGMLEVAGSPRHAPLAHARGPRRVRRGLRGGGSGVRRRCARRPPRPKGAQCNRRIPSGGRWGDRSRFIP